MSRIILVIIVILLLVLLFLSLPMYQRHVEPPPDIRPEDPEAPYDRPGSVEQSPSTDHRP